MSPFRPMAKTCSSMPRETRAAFGFTTSLRFSGDACPEPKMVHRHSGLPIAALWRLKYAVGTARRSKRSISPEERLPPCTQHQDSRWAEEPGGQVATFLSEACTRAVLCDSFRHEEARQ